MSLSVLSIWSCLFLREEFCIKITEVCFSRASIAPAAQRIMPASHGLLFQAWKAVPSGKNILLCCKISLEPVFQCLVLNFADVNRPRFQDLHMSLLLVKFVTGI